MKKKTVITTKKHEVWIIRQGGDGTEDNEQTIEVSSEENDSSGIATKDTMNNCKVQKEERENQD